MSTGLFGKIPAHGDFVRRGLSGGLVSAWDDCAQRGIAASRAGFPGGDAGWQAAWDAAAPWRFALPAGACGSEPVAGVLAFSVDAVGRRFPLLLAATPDPPLPAPTGNGHPGPGDDPLDAILGPPLSPTRDLSSAPSSGPAAAADGAPSAAAFSVPAIAWFDVLEALALAARGGADADALLSLLPAPWPPGPEEAPEAPGWWRDDVVWPLPALPPADEFVLLFAGSPEA